MAMQNVTDFIFMELSRLADMSISHMIEKNYGYKILHVLSLVCLDKVLHV